MAVLRIAMAQLNFAVGDLDGNADRIIEAIASAESNGCDIIAFPELAVTGYPPEDLLLKSSFVEDNLVSLRRIAAGTGRISAVVGFVDSGRGGIDQAAGALFNAAAVCSGGEIVGVYRKRRLPNYSVFDEQRYFETGDEPLALYSVAGVRLGVSICEDAWCADGPMRRLTEGGADLIVNINASPYHRGKVAERDAMLRARATELGITVVYVNLVGGQDELVFDGASVIVDAAGEAIARSGQFVDQVLTVDVDVPVGRVSDDPLPVIAIDSTERPRDDAHGGSNGIASIADELSPVREVYEALVLGTRDYVTKNGFRDVVIGLSGGVDSSLVAAIAVDALGNDRVHGVLMPSRYSSSHSITDAKELVKDLAIEHRVIAIERAHGAFVDLLAESFEGRDPDLTEENLQSRVRGVLLMALSNKFGWMVLTTSNKSESAVGYSTLYGDSAGGFAVIKDVPKLLVYELCRERNARAIAECGHELIPEHVLVKPPSAELRPDQRDDQSLPPYEVLDRIIEAYVDQDATVSDIIADGSFDSDEVRRICRLVDLAEYKRRQFPPGPRITTKAFGKDRRLPVTNLYRG